MPPSARPGPFRLLRRLDAQVIAASVAGVLAGWLFPALGSHLDPLGSGFIKLIRMLLVPIIFGTIVTGLAKVGSLREAGRVGLKALLYFEVVSTLALVIGLVFVDVLRPGAGMNVDPGGLDSRSLAPFTTEAVPGRGTGVAGSILSLIPSSVGDVFVRGDMLQVILFSVLLGVAMARHRERVLPLFTVIEASLQAFFGIFEIVMRLAPVAAFGALAFTVGKYGLGSLVPLARLMAALYGACLFFIVVVLGTLARLAGVSLWGLLRHLWEELVVVFATSSSESVLPRLMAKLEDLGCAKPVVELVVPTGYAFNPDGTSIYLSMAALFIAQATNTHLTLGDQLLVVGVLVWTSKGSAGVASAGFVTLAATLASLGKIPVAGLVLLLGVERFLNAARGVTNVIGNSVATIVVARWENAFDAGRAARVLGRRGPAARPPSLDESP